jgi:hypothetical protein
MRSSDFLLGLHECLKALDRAVTYHADVACRESEFEANGIGRPIVVERHHEYRTLTLRQTAQAVLQAVAVESIRIIFDEKYRVLGEHAEELFTTGTATSAVDDDLPTRSKDERGEPVWFTDGAGTELLQGHQQHVLSEIGGGRLASQMPQAVQADARRKSAAEI